MPGGRPLRVGLGGFGLVLCGVVLCCIDLWRCVVLVWVEAGGGEGVVVALCRGGRRVGDEQRRSKHQRHHESKLHAHAAGQSRGAGQVGV